MMPSAMPACHGRRLRGGELLVELPLQPAVEVDLVGVLGGELGDGRVRRVRSSSGQSCQSPPCFSASAHQVAKSSRRGPRRSRYAA